MDIPAENTGGDCFVEAVNNAMADNSLYVVHGIVHGQGALEGLVFPHAWNETDDGYVIDTSNGHDICMPSSAYYAIGGIDSADVRKYDYQQMAQEVVRTGTYGPWDDMFDFDYRVVGAMKKSHKASSYANKRTAMPWDKLTIGGMARELRDSLSRELYGQPWSNELCDFTIEGKGAFGAKKTAQSSVATFEDINYLLSEAADACAELEDYYFGEPVVDYLVKAYDHCIDAWDQIDRASTLVSE